MICRVTVGRLSQIFWAIEAKEFPSADERQFYYTSLDLSGEQGEIIKRIRRERKKLKRSEIPFEDKDSKK